MGIFDFLKKKENAGLNLIDVPVKIEMAVTVFEENPNEQWPQILAIIDSSLGNQKLALDLFRFIPMAYCRMIMPEVNFSESYVVKEGDDIQREYWLSESQLYAAVDQYVIQRFSKQVSQEHLMGVLNHSTEFIAINSALKNGSQLEDLVLGAPIFT